MPSLLGSRAAACWRNPDFRRLFAGEAVSLIGTYLTQFTMPLIAVLTLRATVFQVGLLNVFRLSPVIVVALFAGVALDRVRRRPVLITCSLCCAVLIGLVPLAQWAGFLSLGLLFAVAAVSGGLNVVFDIGALSYVPNLVDKEQLLEANGKMQTARATGAIAGPAIAGVLIGLITAPVVLSVDAVSYLFSAAGLASIRKPEPAPQLPAARASLWHQLAEGFRAVYGGKLLRSLLTMSSALNLSYGAFWPVFLVYAVRVLLLSPFELGIVVGACAVGCLLGALLTQRVRNLIGYGQSMIYATAGVSLTLLLVLLPHGAGPVTMVILVTAQFLYGVAITVFNVNTITLRQMITPRRLLARMNATYRLLLFGMPPLGALIGGLLGAALGLREALLITLIALTSPMLWLLHSPVFRIHDIPASPDDQPDDQPAGAAPAAAPATAKDGTADD